MTTKPTTTNIPPVAETLKAVVNTLNQVTVNGRMNMDRLLGSIIALEKVIATIEEGKKE